MTVTVTYAQEECPKPAAAREHLSRGASGPCFEGVVITESGNPQLALLDTLRTAVGAGPESWGARIQP